MSRQTQSGAKTPSISKRMSIYHCLCGTLLIVLLTSAVLIMWAVIYHWSAERLLIPERRFAFMHYSKTSFFFLICHMRITGVGVGGWGCLVLFQRLTTNCSSFYFPPRLTIFIVLVPKRTDERSSIEKYSISHVRYVRSHNSCRLIILCMAIAFV